MGRGRAVVNVGDFEIKELSGSLSLSGATTKKVKAAGRATTYLISGPQGTALTVADVLWDSGDRDIRTLDRHVSPQALDRLKQGLRLGIRRHHGRLQIDLAQARLKEGDWSNLYMASWEELDAGAGASVRDILSGLGAERFGNREGLIGDSSRRRNYLCVLFPEDRPLVPVAAYVLTRVAPIVHGIHA